MKRTVVKVAITTSVMLALHKYSVVNICICYIGV